MSLSGDKGVAQFKKSVKMEHPNDHDYKDDGDGDDYEDVDHGDDGDEFVTW